MNSEADPMAVGILDAGLGDPQCHVVNPHEGP